MLLSPPPHLRIQLPWEAIARLCEKYGVSELGVFGSALREDFDPDRSDVDFLVRFINNDAGPWMGKYFDFKEDVEVLLQRPVDVVSWRGVEQSRNPYRREHILNSVVRVYERG